MYIVGVVYIILLKLHMSSTQALVASFLISLIITTIGCLAILLLMKPLLKMLKNTKIFCSFANKLESKFKNKTKEFEKLPFAKIINHKISFARPNMAAISISSSSETIRYVGLLTFVIVPIPGTSIWTGAIASSCMNLETKKALPVLLVGNLISMLLMSGFVGLVASVLGF